MINKEAQVWDMDTLERNYQCIKCGKVHRVDIKKTFSLGDDLYYLTYCPKCVEMVKHLDVGEGITDKYLYYDPVLDEKMY